MNKMHWDTEGEDYQCTSTVGNASGGYCSAWTSFEESPDEWEEGRCTLHFSEQRHTFITYSEHKNDYHTRIQTGTCTEVSESGNFCGKWHCEQDEYDKCGQGEGCNDCDPDGELKCLTLCAQQNSDTQTHTNNTGCQYCYNCYGYDSDGYYYSYNIYPQKEFQDCLCMSDCTFLKKKRQHS